MPTRLIYKHLCLIVKLVSKDTPNRESNVINKEHNGSLTQKELDDTNFQWCKIWQNCFQTL